VSTIAEILELEPDPDEVEDASTVDKDMSRKLKTVVVKTTLRHSIFLPVTGLVPPEELKTNELVGVNKDSYLILEKLPAE